MKNFQIFVKTYYKKLCQKGTEKIEKRSLKSEPRRKLLKLFRFPSFGGTNFLKKVNFQEKPAREKSIEMEAVRDKYVAQASDAMTLGNSIILFVVCFLH